MLIKNAISIYKLLSSLKLNKFTDKETRKNLILTYANLSEVSKKFDEQVKTLREKYLEDVGDELQEVAKIEESLKSETNPEEITKLQNKQLEHKRVYDLSNEFNSEFNKILDSETEVSVSKVNRDKFIEDVSDDITLAQMKELFPIFE